MMLFRRTRKLHKKGFTLIDVIVVLGIIGILTTILVAVYSVYIQNAKIGYAI